jgi:choline dehydrogenase
VTNGNIYAPVIMLAEKAADLIRGNTPTPPSSAQFYRHERATADARASASAAAGPIDKSASPR